MGPLKKHRRLNCFLNVNIKCTGFSSDAVSSLVLRLNMEHRQQAAAEKLAAEKAKAAAVVQDTAAATVTSRSASSDPLQLDLMYPPLPPIPAFSRTLTPPPPPHL